jgi:hypothetical protein
MPSNSLIGSRLRERRLAAGLRQADVAATAGISASYLNLIEHNRRKVTPEVLYKLAEALGVDRQSLAEGAGSALVDDLRAAAAELPGAGAELERLEEFAGRYPGWAAVTAGLQARAGALERAVAALNDRMTHDPHLSSALHELLSALTGVRATAQILAETPDLEAGLRARFHRNLHLDSERLAGGAEALVSFLDGSEAAREQGIAAPQEEVEDWLRRRGWHLEELETQGPEAVEKQIADLASNAARELARALAARLRADVLALPMGRLRAEMAARGTDPGAIAVAFGTDPVRAMRRIALMPGSEAGFVSCDASGTLLFRKPASEFPLPRFGAACPLWPLFAALTRPGAPVVQRVETPGAGRARFLTYAWCQSHLPQGFAGAELREAAMLILPQGGAPGGPDAGAALAIGSTCRICPRTDCLARREPTILKEGL